MFLFTTSNHNRMDVDTIIKNYVLIFCPHKITI